jgi:hypothetical protein
MAHDTHTPIPWFYELPLIKLKVWIESANSAFEKQAKQAKKK